MPALAGFWGFRHVGTRGLDVERGSDLEA